MMVIVLALMVKMVMELVPSLTVKMMIVPTMMARVISPLLVSSTAPPAMLPPILSGTSQRVFIVCKC